MPENKDEYTLLSRAEAAKFLGLSKNTLAVWAVKKHNLTYVKVGRIVQYRLSDLKYFVDKRTHINETYTPR